MRLTRQEIMLCLLGLTEYCKTNPDGEHTPEQVNTARAKLRAEYTRLGTGDTQDAYF